MFRIAISKMDKVHDWNLISRAYLLLLPLSLGCIGSRAHDEIASDENHIVEPAMRLAVDDQPSFPSPGTESGDKSSKRVEVRSVQSALDFDVGDFTFGRRSRYSLSLVNKTEIDLEIEKLHSACGCVAAIAKSSRWKQGEVLDLEFELNAGESGSFEKKIDLQFVSPEDRVSIRVFGTAYPIIDLTPGAILLDPENPQTKLELVVSSHFSLDMTDLVLKENSESSKLIETKILSSNPSTITMEIAPINLSHSIWKRSASFEEWIKFRSRSDGEIIFARLQVRTPRKLLQIPRVLSVDKKNSKSLIFRLLGDQSDLERIGNRLLVRTKDNSKGGAICGEALVIAIEKGMAKFQLRFYDPWEQTLEDRFFELLTLSNEIVSIFEVAQSL